MQQTRKRKVMVICPSSVDRRELSLLKTPKYEIIYHQYDPQTFWQLLYNKQDGHPLHLNQLIDQIIQDAQEHQVDGICSAKDYPGSLLACIAADQLNLCGTPPKALLTCQHKYLSRLKQKEVTPEAVPEFHLLSPDNAWQKQISYPCFFKPIKAMLSFGAMKVNSLADITSAIPDIPQAFTAPLSDALRLYEQPSPEGNFIAEGILKGHQVTIDGYMFQGECTIQGIVDSLMYPKTLSFERFSYPSQLSNYMQTLIVDTTKKVMSHIGYDNGMFNIEFMCNVQRKTVHIIEINTRMASLHADLYEKVDGTNSYEIMLDIATGTQPRMQRNKGKHAIAACFNLRTFHDCYVHEIPNNQQQQEVLDLFPDARIATFARIGKKLSEQIQDCMSYRYALLHLGAASVTQLDQLLAQCLEKLTFNFERCPSSR